MKLTIHNILGNQDKELEFTLGGNTITGENACGKSSACTALQALCTKSSNPLGLSKDKNQDYVFYRGPDGWATIELDGKKVKWNPVSGNITYDDSADTTISTKHAMGLVNFCSGGTHITRARIWQDVFIPDDPKAIIKPYWINLPEKRLDDICAYIRENSWEDAVKVYTEKRREMKARWKAITGTDFGADKAAKWVPMNWRDDLEHKSLDQLQTAEKTAQEELNRMNVEKAVELKGESDITEKRESLTSKQAEINTKQNEYQITKNDIQTRRALSDDSQSKLDSATNKFDGNKKLLDSKAPYNCPTCSAGLEFVSSRLSVWVSPSGDAVKKAVSDNEVLATYIQETKSAMHAQQATLTAAQDTAQAQYEKLHRLRGSVESLIAEIYQFDQRFAEKEKQGQFVSAEDYARMQTTLEQARANIQAFEAKTNADRERDNVVELDTICKILSPTGARYDVLQEGIEKVKSLLASTAKLAGWKPITITDDFAVLINGISVQTCADSEKMKAQFLLQLICALIKNAKCVVLDGADKLRNASWNGLVNVIDQLCVKLPNLHVIVSATATKSPSNWATHSLD